jgi:hypothetical protein
VTGRRFWVLFFALVVLPIAAACAQLTAKDQASIAADAVRIATCQESVRECKRTAGDAAAEKCWPVYDECMTGAGLRDGGK